MRLNISIPSSTIWHRRFVARVAFPVAAILMAGSAVADDWPWFRGPRGDGNYAAPCLLSSGEPVHLEVAWKRKLGSAYSGIAVAHNTAVTLYTDGTDEIVIALDAKTGETLWEHKLAPTYKGHDGSHDGAITTPAIAAGAVFVIAPRGEFAALDLANGKPIWKKNLATDYGAKKPHYGFSTSPLIWDGKLLIELGAPDKAIAALDMTNGEILWSVGSDSVNYQSPVLVEEQDGMKLYACGDEKIMCIDPKNGTLLWEKPHEGGGGRGAASMTAVLCNDNQIFLANKDESSAMFHVVKSDAETALEKTWENNKVRNSYNIPVYHNGHIYAFSSRFLTCVDAKSGDVKWRSRQPGDGFLTLVHDKLVIFTKESSLHIVEATPEEFRELAALPLFEELSWMNPAIADDRIYVRGFGDIACVAVKPGASAAEHAGSLAAAGARSEFASFLKKVERAENKKEVVDAYLAEHSASPIIENDRLAHFYYRGPAKDVAIGGDLFGARQEHAMTHVPGTDFFFHSAELEPDARLTYRYIIDFKDEIVDPRNDRKTISTIYGPDMEMGGGPNAEYEMSWMSMPRWDAPDFLESIDESRRGRIDSHDIESALMETSQPVDVYVPHGYETSQSRYPVAYVHGGPIAQKYGEYPTVLDNLIAEKRMAPTIVVFIKQGPQRDATKFIDMLATEMVPFIDETYRTIPSANARANVGSSFPGFHALLTSLAKPEVFGRTGIQSIFLMARMEAQVNELLEKMTPEGQVIYIDWGKYDLRNPHEAWDLAKSNRELHKKLDTKGFVIRGGEANDGTDWSSYRNRTDDLFSALFPVNENYQ